MLHLRSEKLQHVRNLGNCDLFSKYKFFIIKVDDVKGGVAIFHHAALQVNTKLLLSAITQELVSEVRIYFLTADWI